MFAACVSGDVKNPKLSVALNHYQTATLVNSFTNQNNSVSVGNHRLSEYPYSDTIRSVRAGADLCRSSPLHS